MNQGFAITLNLLKVALSDVAPKIAQGFLPPASQSQIELLRKYSINDLPDDLINFYRETAGTDPSKLCNFAYGVPFETIDSMIKKLKESGFERQDAKHLDFVDKAIVADYMFSKSRLHIGHSGRCVFCIDLNPSEYGTYGQIIMIDSENNVALLVANSLNDLFTNFCDDLSNGRYHLADDALDDGIEWLEPENKIDIINWFSSPSWQYVKKT